MGGDGGGADWVGWTKSERGGLVKLRVARDTHFS